MKAFVFPGQGAQYEGMGQQIIDRTAGDTFLADAGEILGFDIGTVMVSGTAEQLKETKVTQPAIYLHAIHDLQHNRRSHVMEAVAGHSLGEFTALVAAGVLSWQDGLLLVSERALAMQDACDDTPGTMAAILGLDDDVVEQICSDTHGVVVAANYNCPGQLVISGEVTAVETAMQTASDQGARRALRLPVGGAFHSPLMASAQTRLSTAIDATSLSEPSCPIYQNVDATPHTDLETIKANLKAQLTGPVRWTQTIRHMIAEGIDTFYEVGGSGKVLTGLIRKVDRSLTIIPLAKADA